MKDWRILQCVLPLKCNSLMSKFKTEDIVLREKDMLREALARMSQKVKMCHYEKNKGLASQTTPVTVSTPDSSWSTELLVLQWVNVSCKIFIWYLNIYIICVLLILLSGISEFYSCIMAFYLINILWFVSLNLLWALIWASRVLFPQPPTAVHTSFPFEHL